MYTIKIKYKTGNSFNSYEETDLVGHVWQDVSKAKESLKRIKNHYEFMKNNDEYNYVETVLPEGIRWNKELKIYELVLINDNGNDIAVSAFWCGYFERLIRAEIIFYKSKTANNEFVFEP